MSSKIYKVTGNYKEIVTNYMLKGYQPFVDEKTGNYIEADVEKSRLQIQTDLSRDNMLFKEQEKALALNTINNYSFPCYSQGHFSGASAIGRPPLQAYGAEMTNIYQESYHTTCGKFRNNLESKYAEEFKAGFHPTATYDINFSYLSRNNSIDGFSFHSYGHDNSVWLMTKIKRSNNLDDCLVTIYYSEKFYDYVTKELKHDLPGLIKVNEVSVEDVKNQLRNEEEYLTSLQKTVKKPLSKKSPDLSISQLISLDGKAIDNTSDEACALIDNFNEVAEKYRITHEDKKKIITDEELKACFGEDYQKAKTLMGKSITFTRLVVFNLKEKKELINKVLERPSLIELLDTQDNSNELLNSENILDELIQIIDSTEDEKLKEKFGDNFENAKKLMGKSITFTCLLVFKYEENKALIDKVVEKTDLIELLDIQDDEKGLLNSEDNLDELIQIIDSTEDDKLEKMFGDNFENAKKLIDKSITFARLVAFKYEENKALIDKVSKSPALIESLCAHDNVNEAFKNEIILKELINIVDLTERKTNKIASYWKDNKEKKVIYNTAINDYKKAVYQEALRVFLEADKKEKGPQPKFNINAVLEAQNEVDNVLKTHRHPVYDSIMSILTNYILPCVTGGIFNISHAIIHRDKNDKQGNLALRIVRSLSDGELKFYTNTESQRQFRFFKRSLQDKIKESVNQVKEPEKVGFSNS